MNVHNSGICSDLMYRPRDVSSFKEHHICHAEKINPLLLEIICNLTRLLSSSSFQDPPPIRLLYNVVTG
jgi:hypothetical protein